MANPEAFLMALIIAVTLAVLVRVESGGFDPVDDDESIEEPSPFMLTTPVPAFLEFLQRVRQAIESRRA